MHHAPSHTDDTVHSFWQVTKAKKSSPFLPSHWAAWGAVAGLSLAATLVNPAQYGAAVALPFNLAMTLLGFLLGNAMPKVVQVRGCRHELRSSSE